MKKDTVITVIGAALILLFMYTAFSKIFDTRDFHNSMTRQPLPDWVKTIALKTLPIIEILTCVLLIIPVTRLYGFFASTTLMTIFTLYVGLGIAHAFKYVPCSCGGIFRHISWTNHFYINLFFLGISILAILYSIQLRSGKKTKVEANMS